MDNYDGITVGDILTENEIQKKNHRIYENSLIWNSGTGKIEQVPVTQGGGGSATVNIKPQIKTLTDVVSTQLVSIIGSGKQINSISIESLSDTSTLKFGIGDTETIESGKVISFNSGIINVNDVIVNGSFFIVWEEIA